MKYMKASELIKHLEGIIDTHGDDEASMCQNRPAKRMGTISLTHSLLKAWR